MKYKVDGWNNFCRVFELPEKFSSEFCFGGGIPTNFQMVDWFNPIPGLPNPAVSKEVWRENVGKIEEKLVDIQELIDSFEWLKKKTYVKPNRKYLVICNFGAAFILDCLITPPRKVGITGKEWGSG